ncbi:MAG TPA: aconitase X, partial [Burkholderiales bacterium]|nr:aconitase X [Burkholderiales bacterium]
MTGDGAMLLTAEERGMLRGARGDTVRRALELQLEVGKFYGARRFVPVTNVHMMGDIEVMGDGGLDHLRRLARDNARCEVPITTNARCFDFAHVERLGQDAAEAAKEHELIGCLRRMNVMTTDTCINYQTLYQPRLGERLAWGDTGTVIWANSVCGARTNFESGPAAMAAAMTARVPEYGFHLDRHRRGTFVVEVAAALDDYAEWGALAKRVGEAHQSYYAVPVFTGIKRAPTADQLKHLGASLASYGSMAMFHMVGVTPEAPTLSAALGASRPREKLRITRADIDRVFAGYRNLDGNCNFV